MTMWLYQLSEAQWSPERYRLEVWEGERWVWPVRHGSKKGARPQAGDIVVFFFAPTKSKDPGVYGWAVVLEWLEDHRYLYFRPTSPSDRLKMHPWWDGVAQDVINRVRGQVARGTLWRVSDGIADEIRTGVRTWLNAA